MWWGGWPPAPVHGLASSPENRSRTRAFCMQAPPTPFMRATVPFPVYCTPNVTSTARSLEELQLRVPPYRMPPATASPETSRPASGPTCSGAMVTSFRYSRARMTCRGAPDMCVEHSVRRPSTITHRWLSSSLHAPCTRRKSLHALCKRPRPTQRPPLQRSLSGLAVAGVRCVGNTQCTTHEPLHDLHTARWSNVCTARLSAECIPVSLPAPAPPSAPPPILRPCARHPGLPTHAFTPRQPPNPHSPRCAAHPSAPTSHRKYPAAEQGCSMTRQTRATRSTTVTWPRAHSPGRPQLQGPAGNPKHPAIRPLRKRAGARRPSCAPAPPSRSALRLTYTHQLGHCHRHRLLLLAPTPPPFPLQAGLP